MFVCLWRRGRCWVTWPLSVTPQSDLWPTAGLDQDQWGLRGKESVACISSWGICWCFKVLRKSLTWTVCLGPNGSILVSSIQRSLILIIWESFRGFHWAEASIWPFCHEAQICCNDCCPSRCFSQNPHWISGGVSQSDSQALGHTSFQGPSSPIVPCGWAATSGKSPGCSKLFPFQNYRGHYAVGTAKGADLYTT